MAESYELTKQHLYVLITVAIFLAGLFTAFGFVLGRNVQLPESFPSPEELTEQVVIDEDATQLPTEIENLMKSNTDSSSQPHVPNEDLTFYEKYTAKTPSPVTVMVETLNTPTPAPKFTAQPLPTLVPNLKKGFAVQAVALTQKSNAEALVKKLKAKGYPVYIVPKQMKGKKSIYQVRVGLYPTEADAEGIKSNLIHHENLKEAFVISDSKE